MLQETQSFPEIRRRRHQRYGQSGSITIRRAISGPSLSGFLFDISVGGCLVWMSRSVFFNPADVIELRLQADTLSFRVMGYVRNTGEGGRQLGIEFHRLSPQDERNLEDFIARLQACAEREAALMH
jgi:c-di-GMP-binding flagellar brake protein YcgR